MAQVVVGIRFYDMLTLRATELVDDDVMGNTGQPERELAGVGVFPLLQFHNRLDEGVLENVIGNLLVADHEEDIIKQLLLVSC